MGEVSKETLDEIVKRIDANVHEVKQEVVEVKVQTTKTNGSVRSLQLWKSKAEGAIIVLSIIVTAILVPLVLEFLKIHLF